jgi:hypothetical protein
MTHKEFCYWLQGFFEVIQPKSLSKDQVSTIKERLEGTFDELKAPAKSATPKKGPAVTAYDLGAAGRRRNTHPIGGIKYC